MSNNIFCGIIGEHMELLEFNEKLEMAIQEIPEKFKKLLENITIEVDSDQITYSNDNKLILGIYKGVPYKHRKPYYQGVLPDQIIIYKRAFDNYPDERIQSLIKNVLLHEIGHYFGMSEADLEKYKEV